MAVLFYHAVQRGWTSPLALGPDTFGRHCRWLAAHRRIVDVHEWLRRFDSIGRIPSNAVALTFDDGYSSVYDHALPLLRRARIPAAVFVVARTLARDAAGAHWLNHDRPAGVTTLTADQLLEMQDRDVVIGSHGFSHRNLTRLTDEECRRDLRDSRELLEDVLHRPVRLLAYPGGYHDARVRAAAAAAGYTHAFGTSRDREPINRYAIPRIGAYAHDNAVTLAMKTSGWYLRVRRSRAFPALRTIGRAHRLVGRGRENRDPGVASSP